jgi:replicative DNA helicase
MKIHSVHLEAVALRSITDGGDRIAGWILPRLSEEHFSFEPSRDFYRRLMALVRKTGEIPRWDDLLEDLVIAQDSREELAQRRPEVVTSKKDARRLVERLDEYRRARIVFRMQRHIARVFKGDQVNLEELTDQLSDMLGKARSTGDMVDHMVHVGDRKTDTRVIAELMQASRDEFIPTGFRAFDSENQGIPRGSCFIIAATTGGGKSLMAISIALHQARIGARVCIVSLEMSRQEMLRRILSNLTAIPLAQINRAHELDRSTQKALMQAWLDYNARVRRTGGRLTLVSPQDDVTIEDILTLLRPYEYDNTIVDYLGLCKGMDGEDQWRKMGSAARYSKIVAGGSNSIVTLLAQLSNDGVIRYSRAIQEHASLMWTWNYTDAAVRDSRIMTVQQPKARNLKSFPFMLQEKFHIMRLEDVDPALITSTNATKKGGKGGRSEEIGTGARRRTRESRAESGGDGVYQM